MATPFISYHKLKVTYYRELVYQIAYCITCLKTARKTTRRAQFMQFHQITSRRNLLAHYTNCLHFHMNKLDILSGC